MSSWKCSRSTKETLHMKEKLAVDYADLIYNGKWYTRCRRR